MAFRQFEMMNFGQKVLSLNVGLSTSTVTVGATMLRLTQLVVLKQLWVI